MHVEGFLSSLFLNEMTALTLEQHGTLVMVPLPLCSRLYGYKYIYEL